MPPEDVNQLFHESLERIERMLSARSVVGEPMQIEGRTVVPLVSTGFGFGAGTGSGPVPNAPGAANGGGTGAGGGVRPVAVLIAGPEGIRVERLARPSGMSSLGDAIGRAVQSRGEAAGKQA